MAYTTHCVDSPTDFIRTCLGVIIITSLQVSVNTDPQVVQVQGDDLSFDAYMATTGIYCFLWKPLLLCNLLPVDRRAVHSLVFLFYTSSYHSLSMLCVF